MDPPHWRTFLAAQSTRYRRLRFLHRLHERPGPALRAHADLGRVRDHDGFSPRAAAGSGRARSRTRRKAWIREHAIARWFPGERRARGADQLRRPGIGRSSAGSRSCAACPEDSAMPARTSSDSAPASTASASSGDHFRTVRACERCPALKSVATTAFFPSRLSPAPDGSSPPPSRAGPWSCAGGSAPTGSAP